MGWEVRIRELEAESQLGQQVTVEAITGVLGLEPQVVKTVSDGSALVYLQSSDYPRRKAAQRWRVRLMTYPLDDPARPGVGLAHRLVTTLLDELAYPALDLICQYHECWEVELTIDELQPPNAWPPALYAPSNRKPSVKNCGPGCVLTLLPVVPCSRLPLWLTATLTGSVLLTPCASCAMPFPIFNSFILTFIPFSGPPPSPYSSFPTTPAPSPSHSSCPLPSPKHIPRQPSCPSCSASALTLFSPCPCSPLTLIRTVLPFSPRLIIQSPLQWATCVGLDL